ncbi:MAG: chemotaxis protein CheA [Xanthobacteraceae bacterium]|jgi:two-component system chemotaxis sensor kinase CheA
MATLDELRNTFFDECSELLLEIETGLSDMRDANGSEEAVHAVFRAVHSVKGGAGIFGFESLVGFAHVFESVLDTLRRDSSAATPAIISVLLTASDVLSDVVGFARSGEPVPPDYGSDCRAALEQLNRKTNDGAAADDDGTPAPAEFAEIEFTPVRAPDFDGEDEETLRSYAITFRPKPEMLKNANEPLYILRELGKLGDLVLVPETQALPPLSELVPSHPYIGWTGTLRTAAERSAVADVFEFVIGDCELEITELAPQPGADTVIEEPAAVPAAEQSAIAATSPDNTNPPAAPPGKDDQRPDTETSVRAAAAKPAPTTTRVDVDKIDRVVNLVGELVIAQAMLGQLAQGLSDEAAGRLSQMLDDVIHRTRELKDSVMSMRAQPVGAVFQRMPRLVRELSAKTDKKVRLEMFGENTEVDRTIVDRLGDPLTHIIRNSVDHGIETPAERRAAGKSEEGTIRLAAEHRGGRLVIEVSDDGAGVNRERVLSKARDKGLVQPEAVLTDEDITNLIFLPGFSTVEKVSDISGRGVGMDVVRRNIQDLGGRISLKSTRGRGMTIQLALPLTLAVMDGMVIKVAGNTYVMPMSTIVECMHRRADDSHNLLGTRGVIQLRGEWVQLVYLTDLFDLHATAHDSTDSVVIITEASDRMRFGLVVDELCGHQQVVIKNIEESYGSVPGIAAATILGNGRVAFILDVEKLSELAAESKPPTRAGGSTSALAVVNAA